MTRLVLFTVTVGTIIGYLFLPESFIEMSEYIIIIALCGLMFFIGIDMAMQDNVFKHIAKAGLRVIIFPIAIIIGTLGGATFASIFLNISITESLAVGSGFGWYSLAPIIIDQYSAELSAISFLHNVMRELIGILAIPVVAKYIGYIETISLPGAASMDICLPIVEKATHGEIAIYSFISGVILSIAVPIFVPLFMGM